MCSFMKDNVTATHPPKKNLYVSSYATILVKHITDNYLLLIEEDDVISNICTKKKIDIRHL